MLGRVFENCSKRPDIERDLAKSWAGYHGERSLFYYLRLPEKDYIIFHDLRLPNGTSFFQIDILILSTKFALILEVKNIIGTLYFDQPSSQLIRTLNEKEEGLPDPITQAKRHKKQLENWFKENLHIQLPVEYLIVITNPSTIIKTDPRKYQLFKKVIHSSLFLERFEEIRGRYNEEIYESKQLRKITKLLLKSHTPPTFDILKMYQLTEKEIKTGVQCPSCGFLPIIRKSRKWFCSRCDKYDKHAHIQAVYDYFLLIDKTLTNEKLRNFLHLSSSDTATRLLKSMNLSSHGSNKGKVYHSPTDFGLISAKK